MAAGGGPEGSRWCERSERPPVVRALVSSTLEGSRSFAGLRRKLPFLVKPPRLLQGRSPVAKTKTGGRSLRSHHRLPSVPPPAEKAERRRPAGWPGGVLAPGGGARLARRSFVSRCWVSASNATVRGGTPHGQPAGRRRSSAYGGSKCPNSRLEWSLCGGKHVGLGAAARAQGYANQRRRSYRLGVSPSGVPPASNPWPQAAERAAPGPRRPMWGSCSRRTPDRRLPNPDRCSSRDPWLRRPPSRSRC